LKLLAEFQPDIVKIDMDLVRDVESEAERRWFARQGVKLFQGYLIGRPALGQLVAPQVPLFCKGARPAQA
jgi:EAL domain-containing protein (putative c-di-GMP-specific phosphodiesterase class I)